MILFEKPNDEEKIDARNTMYPTFARFMLSPEGQNKAWGGGEITNTTYGFVLSGSAILHHKVEEDTSLLDVSSTLRNEHGVERTLYAGDYFAMTGRWSIESPLNEDTQIWTVTRIGFRAPNQFGMVENKGRLSYIDGCSDSVLVSMPRMGDPVLNYLHFPSGIYQTQHTHPSIRMGVVISGEGEAFMEKTTTSDGWVKPLRAGMMFMLEEQELHSFRTFESHMDIVAYHPDSDTGPTDENHSMINRTYIDHGK